jgi:hypothetical protein
VISPSIDESGNAFVALAHRAKATPGPMLVACEIAGFGTALVIYAIAPSHASIAFPFLAIGAFGLWGIIDHVLESPPRLKSWRRSALRSFQFLVAMMGITFAIATGFVAAGWLMGTFVL